MHEIPNEDAVASYFEKYSNWGRWGPADEAGALNLITRETRLAAIAEVTEGLTVSCSWPIVMNQQRTNDVFTPMRLMHSTGEGLSAERLRLEGRSAMAAEWIGMQFHGNTITHIDALCHNSVDARMYNGFAAESVSALSGAAKLGVTAAGASLMARGVLLDIASTKGVRWLGSAEAVFPEDLEAAEERQGVRVRSGDVVLLHTGHCRRIADEGIVPLAQGLPGWHVACIPWLYEREVSMIGADMANDVIPSGYASFAYPVHAVCLVAMGVWLIDNMNTEGLRTTCEKLERWSFLLAMPALLMEGATGSPVNPIAMF